MYEKCPTCNGTGLQLNFIGEPDECSNCKSNTVIYTNDNTQFKLGDYVKVLLNPDKPWTLDWLDVECEIYGLRYNKNKSINITLFTNDDSGLTDGFLPEDLILT